jgi:hypothetical protein
MVYFYACSTELLAPKHVLITVVAETLIKWMSQYYLPLYHEIASVEMQLSLIKLTFSNEQQSAACRLLNEDSDAGRNCRSDPEGQVLFICILKVSFPLPRNTALHFNLLLAVRREPILIRKDVKSGITTAIIRTEEGGGMNE